MQNQWKRGKERMMRLRPRLLRGLASRIGLAADTFSQPEFRPFAGMTIFLKMENTVSAGSRFDFESIQSAFYWRGTPWAVNGAVALFVTLSLWQNVSQFSNQPGPAAPFPAPAVAAAISEQDLNAVRIASLFGEPQAGAAATPETAPLTSLNLLLKGVVAIKDAGMAFVSVQGKPEDLFLIGQEIAPGAVLSAVHPDRIILRRGQQYESLMLDGADDMSGIEILVAGQATIARAASPGKDSVAKPYVISRASLRAEVQGPQELLSQAVLVPNTGGGFLLKEVQPDSLIEEFGLRPGDVIQTINGQTLNYADDIRRAYERLANASDVKVELLRDGRSEVMYYRVVEGVRGEVNRKKPHRSVESEFPMSLHDLSPVDSSSNRASESSIGNDIGVDSSAF